MHHDWHSEQYVTDWIAHDVARDPERRPRLQEMLEMAPFPRDAAIKVLDVGAGYGAVTEEVLKRFPNARVTLQDYSQPMLAEAERRLSPYAARLHYVTADLTDPAWPQAVGGPFDLAVSAIALHICASRRRSSPAIARSAICCGPKACFSITTCSLPGPRVTWPS
jgi:trans-aconitate methyltransferase